MVEHRRTLDFKIAFAIGLGTMIAAGIFSLSGTAAAAIGSSAVVAFVLAAIVAGLTAASYSEFASIYAENSGVLVIGATRTRRLRRWVFGSTPDRVIELAKGEELSVLVYASPRGVHGPIEDYVYPVYRALTGRLRRPTDESESSTVVESRSN